MLGKELPKESEINFSYPSKEEFKELAKYDGEIKLESLETYSTYVWSIKLNFTNGFNTPMFKTHTFDLCRKYEFDTSKTIRKISVKTVPYRGETHLMVGIKMLDDEGNELIQFDYDS